MIYCTFSHRGVGSVLKEHVSYFLPLSMCGASSVMRNDNSRVRNLPASTSTITILTSTWLRHQDKASFRPVDVRHSTIDSVLGVSAPSRFSKKTILQKVSEIIYRHQAQDGRSQ